MRILEIAAGTGRATRHIARRLPPDGLLCATDLSVEMIAVGQRSLPDERIEWSVADALDLPFGDEEFDSAVCQFGVMFLPDRKRGFRETFRVLRPGGTYFFSSWNSHSENKWASVCHRVVGELYPTDPIVFMAKPFSYNDPSQMIDEVSAAGFTDVTIEAKQFELVADSAGAFALGVVAGTPLCTAITERSGSVDDCVHAVAEAFRSEFGDRPMQSTISALVVSGRKP